MKETKPVLVLGGGIAGLTAARELARNGVSVILLEREGHLGGHVGRWACMATNKCQKCSACLIAGLKQEVLDSELIQVYTQGTLGKIAVEKKGIHAQVTPCSDNGGIKHKGLQIPEGTAVTNTEEWDTDAVFVATGFQTFSARVKPMLHYGELSSVMTTEDLNEIIREDRLDSLSPADGSKLRVAFLQCIGSRDREAGRDYCSQVCCKTSLRLAARLLQEKPDCEITLFYIDLQIFGKGFREFYTSFKDRIRLVQGVPSEVLSTGDDKASLVFESPIDGEVKTEIFERVVLAVGMLPGHDAQKLADMLSLSFDQGGFFQKKQEGRKSQIYTIGACRSPMDIVGARRQALEAVGRYLAK